MRTLLLLMLPALVCWALAKLKRRIAPGWIARGLQWLGRVGNLTLAVYCGLVAGYALVASIRFSDVRGDIEIILGLGVAVIMAVLSVQFWRAAKPFER